MKNNNNLHAANAASVVGNAMGLPPRMKATATPTTVTATISASAAAQMKLNQMRSGYKGTNPLTMQQTSSGLNLMMGAANTNGGMNTNSLLHTQATAMNNLNLNNTDSLQMTDISSMSNGSSAVLSTAGAGAVQLSGRWSLDREHSDSTNDYLEAMGLPLIARQAADKLDIMVIIDQNPGEFIITRRTRIFTETKSLKFGQEVNCKNNLIHVSGDETHVKTVTKLSGHRGILTDIRSLDEQGRMHVELTLVLPDKPPVVTHRYFIKTSDSVSLENLPAFDISLENANEPKRKR